MQIKTIKDKIQFNHHDNISKTTIDQFNFLQKTLGNQNVQEMVNKGIITGNADATGDMEIRIKKQKEREAEQIQADRKALTPQIETLMHQKQVELEAQRLKNPAKDIYANVTTELHFVQTPGDTPHEFYHYTDLVDINFSMHNTFDIGAPEEIRRGYTIKVIDSFLCEQEPEFIVNAEEALKDETPIEEETTAIEPPEEDAGTV